MSQKIATAVLEIRTDVSQATAGIQDLQGNITTFGREGGAALSHFGEIVGVAFGVEMVREFAGAILETADTLVKLRDKTGLSLGALQDLQAVADESGNSVEQLAAAMNKFQVNFSKGDAAKPLQELGLSIQQLQGLEPEAQLKIIADAFQGIRDPADQTRLAVELFGRAGAEILPTLKAGFDDVGDSALHMSDDVIEALNKTGDYLKRLKLDAENVAATLGVNFAEYLLGPAGNVLMIADAIDEINKGLEKLAKGNRAPKQFTAVPNASRSSAGELQFAVPSDRDIQQFNKGIDDAIEAQKKLAAEAKKAADALQRQVDTVLHQRGDIIAQFLGVDDLEKAERTIEALGAGIAQIIDVSRLTKDRQQDLKKTLDSVFDVYTAIGRTVPPQLVDLAAKLWAVTVPAAKLEELGQKAQMGGPLLNASAIPGVPAFIAPVAGPAGIKTGNQFVSGFRMSLDKNLPNTILRAIEGGGNVAEAVGATFGQAMGAGLAANFGKAITSKLGSFLGGIAKDLLPGLGSLLGPLLDKLFSIGGPSAAEKAGRSTEGSVEDKYAAMLTAQERLAAGSSRLTQGVLGLSKAFQQQGMSVDDANRAANAYFDDLLRAEPLGDAAVKNVADRIQAQLDGLAAVHDGVGALVQAVADAGGSMPDDLRPMLDTLLQMGGLTDDERAKIEALKNGAAPDWKQMQADAQEFGVSLDALGKGFQQSKIEDLSARISKFFKEVKDGGGDVGAFMAGVSDETRDMVQNALKAGAAIPESMREIVEFMFNTGQLVDADGEKLDDISKISFEDTPLDKSSKAIVDAINHLGDILKGLPGIARTAASGIAGALDGIPDKTIDVNVNTNYTHTGDPTAGKGGTGDAWPGPFNTDGTPDYDGDPATPMLRGGFGRVSRAHLFLAGEAGAEDVVFGGAGRNLAEDVAAALSGMVPQNGGSMRPIEITFAPKWDGVTLTKSVHRVYENGGQIVIDARELLGVR